MADVGIIKFQLAGMHFGIYADQILEIVRLTDVRTIPRPLPYVVGLAELRHYLVVVVDLRKRLGLTPLPFVKDTPMIIAKIASGIVGLLVESISHFTRFMDNTMLPPISIAGIPEHLISGIFSEGDELVIVPNFDKIFRSYIHIRLVSVTALEKMAFQYRLRPGGLTRTLEKTLMKQHHLEEHFVRILPRSMSISSVAVHKMTSFYPDFFPKASGNRPSEPGISPTISPAKAGDETYLSLSQELEVQDQTSGSSTSRLETESETHAIQPALLAGKTHGLEALLLEDSERRGEGNAALADDLESDPALGNQLAETLQIHPAQLTKYLRYYTESSPTLPGRAPLMSSHTFVQSGMSFENQFQELCQIAPRLEDFLFVLHEQRTTLTRSHLRWIANHYGVSLVKIAKLFLNFSHLSYKPEPDAEETGTAESKMPAEVKSATSASPLKREKTLHFEQQSAAGSFSKHTLSECLGVLGEQGTLSDESALRRIASQWRIPTCRLSKLRSFYRFRSDVE